MTNMRRNLPPLNPVRAFEAAARLLSFTAAAKELNVSQVAVSRQVKVLEDYLEVALFDRGARSVQLTPEGVRLLPGLTSALSEIERVVSSVTMRGRRNVVSIQAYTTFAQWWLIPRLNAFHHAHPEIEVRLTASLAEVNFGRQNIDAVIASKPSEQPRNVSEFLLPCHMLPVCSPDLIKDVQGGLKPDDVRRFTILNSLSRPDAWSDWLVSAGCHNVRATRGLQFETSAMAFEAALGGMGVAMGILELVHEHLISGRFVAPFGHVAECERGYYIVRPGDRPASAALARFVAWLTEQARTSRAEETKTLARWTAMTPSRESIH